MRISKLLKLIDETGLSPERAAKRLGVSNMTIRRWRTAPARAALPAMYERAFEPVLWELVAEGLLKEESMARAGFGAHGGESFRAALKRLGFPDDALKPETSEKDLLKGLTKIGEDATRAKAVERDLTRLGRFTARGEEWKARITGLCRVIQSKELLRSDKLIAYGALFYFLTPMDLLPDTIPVIGLLDDFAILGIALLSYRKRFPKLFVKR